MDSRIARAEFADRTVEGGEEAVTRRIQLPAAEPAEQRANERVVALNEFAPASVPSSTSFSVERTMSVKGLARTVSGCTASRPTKYRWTSGRRVSLQVDRSIGTGKPTRRAPGMRSETRQPSHDPPVRAISALALSSLRARHEHPCQPPSASGSRSRPG